jgi:hypothetical protein
MSAADPAVRRLFTIEEANQRLPLVRAIVQDIVVMYRDLLERRERLENVKRIRGQAQTGRMYSEELEQVEADIDRDEEKLMGYVHELAELGAELKDPRTGLIDFPAQLEERIVCLCWKLGENDIEHWHEVDAGFAGRQPVSPEMFHTTPAL